MKKLNSALLYHSIGDNGCKEAGAELYSLSVAGFKEQMRYLSSIDSRPLITFDDGLLNNYTHAYPILRDFGLKAYFFILVGKIGSNGYMNQEQIKELKSYGMVIGSHGLTHRILTQLSAGELEDEIKASKRALEDALGIEIDNFSVPRGFYNQKVMQLIKEAGYKAAFTSDPNDFDSLKIGRIPVKASWDLEYFKRVLKNGLPLKARAGRLIKKSVSTVLGAGRYDALRTRLLKK